MTAFKKKNATLAALIRELRHLGVDDFEVKQGRTHLRLIYLWRGCRMTTFVSGTCSDQRAPKNAVSMLRRQLGVERVVHKNPANRRRRHRKPVAGKPLRLPEITPGKDPSAALGEIVVPRNRSIEARIFADVERRTREAVSRIHQFAGAA